MTTITTSLSVNIKQGPQISIPPIKTEVEAYDKIDVSIPPGADVEVNVQPGDTGVSFLLITSSVYALDKVEYAENLTYKPGDKPAISLDTPQLYLGTGSITALIGSVQKIMFSNKLPEIPEVPEIPATATEPAIPMVPAVPSPTAEISILVGRDATPTPTPTPPPTS